MKTRTRTSSVKTSSEGNNTPIILGLLLVTIIYSVFWNAIADVSLILYLIWLFCIAPLFVIAWNLIKKLLIVSYSFNTIKFIASFVWINLLILCFVSRWNGFIYLLGLYSFLIAFISYIPYLESKHTQKLSKLKLQSKHRWLFKIHLEDKNFLNQQNYFMSPKNKEIYRLAMRKKHILGILIGSMIIPLFMIGTWFNELSSWSITFLGLLWIALILYTVIVITRWAKYILDNFIWKTPNNMLFYQEKMDTSKFLKYRNKIFFY